MISSLSNLKFEPLGEQVITVQFENEISVQTNSKVRSYANIVKNSSIPGIKQLIPTYRSLAIRYDPIVIGYDELISNLKKIDSIKLSLDNTNGKIIHIPVSYGGEHGIDLDEVADRTELSIEDVIQIHSANRYLVYMLGFIASYPHCGGLDKRLFLPRRKSPRLKVAKGTIAIVNELTIIYTIESPGGWHNIGRTPMQTFNPLLDPPSIFRVGDYIKFIPITSKELEEWNEEKQREWNEKWNL